MKVINIPESAYFKDYAGMVSHTCTRICYLRQCHAVADRRPRRRGPAAPLLRRRCAPAMRLSPHAAPAIAVVGAPCLHPPATMPAAPACLHHPFEVLSPSAPCHPSLPQAYNYDTRKLAILSQEEAAIWVCLPAAPQLPCSCPAAFPPPAAVLLLLCRPPLPGSVPASVAVHMPLSLWLQVGDFHGDKLEFASQEGQVFHLPRDNHCEACRRRPRRLPALPACLPACLPALRRASPGFPALPPSSCPDPPRLPLIQRAFPPSLVPPHPSPLHLHPACPPADRVLQRGGHHMDRPLPHRHRLRQSQELPALLVGGWRLEAGSGCALGAAPLCAARRWNCAALALPVPATSPAASPRRAPPAAGPASH